MNLVEFSVGMLESWVVNRCRISVYKVEVLGSYKLKLLARIPKQPCIKVAILLSAVMYSFI